MTTCLSRCDRPATFSMKIKMGSMSAMVLMQALKVRPVVPVAFFKQPLFLAEVLVGARNRLAGESASVEEAFFHAPVTLLDITVATAAGEAQQICKDRLEFHHT